MTFVISNSNLAMLTKATDHIKLLVKPFMLECPGGSCGNNCSGTCATSPCTNLCAATSH